MMQMKRIAGTPIANIKETAELPLQPSKRRDSKIPQSRLDRLWSRLTDNSKLPRRLWFPVYSCKVFASPEEWQREHDEVSTTIRRTMTALIGYCLFSLLALGAPVKDLISNNAITIPVADSTVSFSAFLIVGPLILLCLTSYLHIFLGYLTELGQPREKASLPFLFNMQKRFPLLLTDTIFYWLTPIVLFVFAVTARIQGRTYVLLLTFIAVITTMLLLVIKIRRSHWTKSSFQPFRWLFLVSIPFIVLLVLIWSNAFYSEGANLRSADLRRLKIEYAELAHANLSFADLSYSELRYADFASAYLFETKLNYADLQHSSFERTALEHTEFVGANLSNANLFGAKFIRADLTNANLFGAALRHAYFFQSSLDNVNLECANLNNATLNIENYKNMNIKHAMIRSLRHAPDGFREWALKNGATEKYQEYNDWKTNNIC